jgi:hypothetical protein
MPTDEWFKENPKVSAYIPQSLNEKLTDWMKGRSIKKVSQALTTILEEYLGVEQNKPNTQPIRDDRLEALEQKLESLFQTVQELREPINSSSQRVVQTELFPVEPVEEPLSDDEAIALIDAKRPIDVLEEEIQDDEPDEILAGFLEPEAQPSNSDVDEEENETAESEQTKEGSSKLEQSSLNAENQAASELKAVMSTKELAKFLGWAESKLSARKGRGQAVEKDGISFIWEKEGGSIVWKPEPAKPLKPQEAPNQVVQ